MNRSTTEPRATPDRKDEEPIEPGLWNALMTAGRQWLAHRSPKAGASLAYYSIFSMGPLVVVIISVAALVFDREGVQREVVEAIRGLIGEEGAAAVGTMLSGADRPRQGVFATVIGVAALLFAAVGVVVQLKDALNRVWEVEPQHRSGLWGFTREYVLSLAGLLAFAFLMLISMLLAAGVASMGKVVGSALPEAVMHVLQFCVSFLTTAATFALLFKWMPDTHVAWRDVMLGAVGTAVLFEIGKWAIGFYIGKQGLESTYGASASIVVLLIWVYYSAQILLFGAEFTRCRARQRGKA
jgi:membrane protein